MKIETVSNKDYLKKISSKISIISNYNTLNSSFLIETLTDDSSFFIY